MPLFEVAILEEPSKREKERESKPEKLVMPPTAVIASDPQSAAISVVLDKPDVLAGVDRTRMRVLIRPFG